MKKLLSKVRGMLTPAELATATLDANTFVDTEPSVVEITDNETTVETSPEAIDAIEKLWQDYEEWLSENFEQGLKDLNPGVSESHLIILEKSLNSELPKDYRDWLKVHNGQRADGAGLIYGSELLQVARLLEVWFSMKKSLADGELNQLASSEPEGTINPVWWHLKWLPISADGAGNLVCIDLKPDENGVSGQIISFDHEAPERRVLANSFKEYIVDYLHDLESEKYTYSKSQNALLPSAND